MPKPPQNTVLPRRTLQELAAIYKLERTTRDVIVEGGGDKCLIEWFLGDNDVENVVVYEISSFQIDAQAVRKWGGENNNRGRVISLACEMEATVGDRIYLTCIADTDLDTILENRHNCKLLLLTDYTCMEMYAFNPTVLNKYLKLNHGHFPKPAKTVLAEITPALEQLFLARIVNFMLDLNLEAVAFERSCELRTDGVHLDVRDYVGRYLSKNRKASGIGGFLSEMSKYEKRLTSDPRNQIQGHDFLNLLSWYIAQHKGFSRLQEEMLQRPLFTAAAESARLRAEPLFEALLSRLGNVV
ncbi:MAG: hypothetical protein WA188_00755 [Terriglobales bacterium]